MKIRQGFVSNSSSSSFIIGLDLNANGKIEIDPKILGELITCKEELVKQMLSDSYTMEQIERSSKYKLLAAGKKVLVMDVENDSCGTVENKLMAAKIDFIFDD